MPDELHGMAAWMDQMASSMQSLQLNLDDVLEHNRQLQEQVTLLTKFPQQSTRSFDEILCPVIILPSSIIPARNMLINVSSTAYRSSTLLFLSPLSPEEKRTFAAQMHSIKTMDYTAPPIPKRVVLKRDNLNVGPSYAEARKKRVSATYKDNMLGISLGLRYPGIPVFTQKGDLNIWR